ncbi:hypothetical protein B7R22_05395 [Subtercola boreus]|uniref:Terminase small subunit n=1 Tax=Subtercola boreus TaxID=120213 RepID=A0A3E0VZ04_9MICO|nr:hypothetical protein B7R21_06380 [Subtercola boreus]RFA15843.1 hypothetical protein B7R22_05395 [Subtercola boreus]
MRRDRTDDAAWVTLPAEGFDGAVPAFPLPAIPIYDIYWEDKRRIKEFDKDATDDLHAREIELWEDLWSKPQAAMWSKLSLKYEVAAYVRGYIESTSAESNSGLKTAALRMAAEIGLSLPGMHSLRWRFSEDELSVKRSSAPARKAATSAKARFAALSNG